jgi:hypothetical protein
MQECPARRFFTMSSATLYRWSGIVLLVGSLLGVIELILSAILYPGHNLTPQQVLSTPFTIVVSLFLIWALLLAMGLPGLYLRQATRAGALGFAGFVLLSLGVLLGVWPLLTSRSPSFRTWHSRLQSCSHQEGPGRIPGFCCGFSPRASCLSSETSCLGLPPGVPGSFHAGRGFFSSSPGFCFSSRSLLSLLPSVISSISPAMRPSSWRWHGAGTCL